MTSMSTRAWILAAGLLVLISVNYSIMGKERIIRGGETIYLELAPVDPRSLMQGDYMALRFGLASSIAVSRLNAPAATMRFGIALDEKRVARAAPADGNSDLSIRYRIRNGDVWIGTNAYFFEEGSAARFENARYGEFKVDAASGDAVLVGLRDRDMRAL
jgi:uncharacterized membrane-anchored protein